jgi:DNA-binding response OmpR family regulator
LRRPNLVDTERVVVGAIQIDLKAREVVASDGPLSLTPVEFEILALLARRKGSAVTRDALVDAALDPGHDASRRTLDVHISRLRGKLGTNAAQLETVWGIGYRLSERP